MMKLHLILTGLSVVTLSACAVTTAGVTPGDERNLARSVNDVSADRVISARMKRAHGYDLKGVNVDVAEGIVVLSGNVMTPEERTEAERIAWSAPHIKTVGNEIFIKEEQGTVRNMKDGLLHQSVKTRLLAEKSVKGRNFNIEVNEGIVYLSGVARDPAELQRAAYIASTTKGTAEVVSYVTIHNQGETVPTYNDAPQYAPQNTNPYSDTSPYSDAPTYRELPRGLSDTPPTIEGALPDTEPYYLDPQTGERIELPPGVVPIPFVPDAPGSLGAGATPPPGYKVGESFPSDSDLGTYRSGPTGQTVSELESEPYYIDPDTGEQIPVSFINGRTTPKTIR